MKTVEPIVVIVCTVAAFSIQMLYFLLDNKTPDTDNRDKFYKRMWHIAGGALHIWLGYVVEKLYGHGWGWVAGASTWYFFDGVLNTWYFHKPFFSIGTTAFIDRTQQWLAKWFKEDPTVVSAILKNTVLLLSILNLFIW